MGASISYAAPKVQTSGATFAQLQAGGFGAVLDLLVAANPAVADPATAPTVSVTGGGTTGGNLPAGTYYVSYAWDTGFGRTKAKESASSFTVSSGNIPQVTLPSFPTGVGLAAVYLTAAGGASGSETFYGYATATTFNLASATWGNPLEAPQSANTSGASVLQPRINAPRGRLAWTAFEAYLDRLSAFLRGDAVDQASALQGTRHFAAILHALAQAADDVATLAHANTGTLTTTTSAYRSAPTPKRTFP